ncbi:fructosamine kinase family protein [Thalassospira povalilytica]|uniref:Fructosamine kinase family protein n=1 Tax=Thalassospira povalilytica TaxID=732237 RepID=A0A8I1SHC7_9PROT|nr:fructosamine kinase family protein [Thalassospira povalilytica]MBN8194889.1 fructosamine kinase family protein [Thalassospira povalilytica]
MDRNAATSLIERLTGCPVKQITHMSGGSFAEVIRLDLSDGRSVVAKIASSGKGDLETEAEMLRYFAKHSPIACPDVIHADQDCLVMTYVANDNRMSQSVQRDLAVQLAAQHQVTAPKFGLAFDTLIGGLHQPNRFEQSWVTFFGENRLRHMAQAAHREGQLPASLTVRIDHLIQRLEHFIDDKPQSSLLHGDLWGENILCQDGRVAALIDPAIYYGDREIELAFGTLFGDLGPDFFGQYHEILPIAPGFFEERRDLYNLYPLLVHVRLFGAPYVRSVENILERFGV